LPPARVLQEIGVALFVVSMMVSVGLDLTPRDLTHVFRRPGRLLVSFAVNYLAVPAVAWVVCRVLRLPEPIAAAILLVAAAPGGPVGPVLTRTAGGDLALATAFVVVTNIANTVATPALTALLDFAPPAGAHETPLLGMAWAILVYQLIPLGLAVAVRHWQPVFAGRARPWVNRFMNAVIFAVGVGFLLTHGVVTLAIPLSAALAIVGGIVASLTLGWWIAPARRADQVALSLSTGIRSLSVVLLVITAWYPDPRTLVVAMAYSMSMFAFTAGLALLLRRRISAAASGAGSS